MIPSCVKVFNQTIPDVGVICIRESRGIPVGVEVIVLVIVIGIRDLDLDLDL